MMRNSLASAATLALLTGLAAPAMADDASEIAQLKQRVSELEQQQQRVGPSPDLKFNVTSNTELEVYGFVRFEAFYDFDFAQGDLTRTNRIGDPAFATDGEFETSVRTSRLGFRSKTQTDFGEIGAQLEFDLFSGSDTTTSPQLRLRHANLTIGDRWLFGQTWTNFMPLTHYPRTADFNGPVGIAFARTPQIRYTYAANNGFTFSTSIEEAVGGSSDPVLTAAAFYQGEKFSARVAGLVGSFESGGNDYDTSGVTVSATVSPWEGGNFTATYVTGEAIGNLLIGGGARVVGGVTNDADGYTLEYRQDVSDTLNVGIAYGKEDYDLPTVGGLGDFTELETVFLNAFWQPTDRLTIAGELIRGESTNSAGVTSTANRIGGSVTFAF